MGKGKTTSKRCRDGGGKSAINRKKEVDNDVVSLV